MPQPDPGSPDVLVVGAGPTGLLTAIELQRRGVTVRVVDRAPAPVDYSKALLLWPRTMDVLREMGLDAEARDRSIAIDSFRYYSDGVQLCDVRFPTDLASRALPQVSTEDLLREEFARRGGLVERGVRLLALDGVDFSGDPARSDGVTAILEHADGRVERATAPWLVGADGAGSAVRSQLGIAFSGATYPAHFVLGDAYVREPGALAADEAHYFQSPRGVLVVVALPDGLFRFFASVAGPPEGPVDLALVQQLVDERGPGGITLHDPHWTSAFRVHCRQADRFQLGRVFLVGDAAHVHSPAGGQGLNTGMQDGHNLAWKLADVVHGRAGYGLLDSYTPERHAVARRVLRDTDVQTKAWMVRDPRLVTARDAAFRLAHRTGLIERGYLPTMAGRRLHYDTATSAALLAPARGHRRGALRVGTALTPQLTARLGLDDVGVHGWTLCVADERHLPARPAPGLEAVVSPGLPTLPGCLRSGFVLVRPDRVVAARGPAGDVPAAVAWFAGLAEGAPPPRRTADGNGTWVGSFPWQRTSPSQACPSRSASATT